MFRFTIRDVLWLTVVVGLGLGWWQSYRWQSQKLCLLDVVRFEGGRGEADLSVMTEGETVSVFVMYGSGRTDGGQLLGTRPGGHMKYVLTRSGKTIDIIPGR